ncbi:MAG: MvaI/BcnI family restriction endonuclease [Candidatus Micrarchaeota archaeon]|nr:MvaI/BcnI family restriction endonuclease [Candidatus Micrarchaeota archaeon]
MGLTANDEQELLPIIDFRRRLKEIYKLGFVKSLRSSDTGVGKTLEELFGIPENNVSNDFQFDGRIIELKSQRINASSRVTLITKSPYWDPFSAEEIIKRYGYPDAKGRQGLKVTVTTIDFNARRLKLQVDKPANQINVIHKKDGVICYFKIDGLMDRIHKKLSQNLLIVFAETRKKRRVEQFHYSEAYFLSDLSEDNFEQLLLGGKVVWEFRMDIRQRKTGKRCLFVRDHGAGFRISEKYLPELYATKEKIQMD